MDSIRSNISQAFNFSDEDKSSNGNVSGSNSNNNDDKGPDNTSASSSTTTSNTSQRAISTTTGGLLVDEHLEKYECVHHVVLAHMVKSQKDNTEQSHQ